MARELKKILNQRIGLSITLGDSDFASNFANGYLIGEILFKFGLQPDFAFFENSQDEAIKIRNFSRILPAVEDMNMTLSLSEVQKMTQVTPGVAEYFVYILLKTLKVLPMRDPKWTIEKAEKFQRKGSWMQFAAVLNMDYATYKAMDDKYHIPGEDRCRQAEAKLRQFLERKQPVETNIDMTLVPLRADAAERTKYSSDWEGAVQRELDEFDQKLDKIRHPPLPPPVADQPVASPEVPPSPSPTKGRSKTNPKSPDLHSSKSAQRVSKDSEPSAARLPSVHEIKQSKSAVDLQAEKDMLMAPVEVDPPVLFATLPESSVVKPKKSLSSFNKKTYLSNIKQKSEEYKTRKEEAAKNTQALWMDLLIEKKRQREEEQSIQLIRKINVKAEEDRKQALALLYKRREEFDELYRKVKKREGEDEERQYVYVKAMVNEGFWDLLGDDLLTEDRLKGWCEKAKVRYFPEIYQIFSREYNMCKGILWKHYEADFFVMAERVTKEAGEDFVLLVDPEAPVVEPEGPFVRQEPNQEPLFDEPVAEPEVVVLEDDYSSDQSTLFWDDVELDEYRDISTGFPYEELGWMTDFVSNIVQERRYLGHIVSCCLNGEEWRPAPVPEFKFSRKFVSLWVVGKRSSPLKMAVVNKLATMYNLEVLSVADLVHEAVETALQPPPEAPVEKDKGGRRKSKVGTSETKKSSVTTALKRRKSKSFPTSMTSLVAADHNSIRNNYAQTQRLLRKLMDDAAIDPNLLIDLVEHAIEQRVLRPPKVKVAEEAVNAGGASTAVKSGHPVKLDAKHHGKHDPKASEPVPDPHSPEKVEEPPPPPPFGWIMTDFPVALDFLQVLESRLGICSTDPSPPRDTWQEARWVADEFGPKPQSAPRSFFGAILRIDYSKESELLADAKFAPPNLTIDAVDKVKSKEFLKEADEPVVAENVPQKPVGKLTKGKGGTPNHDEVEEWPPPPEAVRSKLTKYLKTFEEVNEGAWSNLQHFYSNFLIEHVGKYDDWDEPDKVFTALRQVVEEVMRLNRTICSFGVSAEAQAQISDILHKVCEYIWNYRTAIRHQLARRLLGKQIAKSVIHYLFKQDIVLIRDVYCKCESRLRDIVSKSPDKIPKRIALAIYRKSSFPLLKRLNNDKVLIEQTFGVNRARKLRRLIKDHRRSDGYTMFTTKPATKTFRNVEEIQKEFLTLKENEFGSSSAEFSTSSDGQDIEVRLHDWMENTMRPLSSRITSWHRSNKLFVDIQELSPQTEQLSVFKFPFVGAAKFPHIVTLWKEVESVHVDKIVHLMPSLRNAEGRLGGNTRTVKEIFQTCVNQASTSLERKMADFSAKFNEQHQRNPDIHPAKDWQRKLDAFYEAVCNITDYRHSGRQTCLRKLMGSSGYTEVILSFRNACLGLIQAEMEHFRHVLRFLWKLYISMCHTGIHSDLSLEHFVPPVFLINEDALKGVKVFIEECNLEAKIKLDRFLTSGSPEEEQRSFLDIVDDDEEFWWKILQAVRFHLDGFVEVFTRKLSRPVNTERDDEEQLDELIQTEADADTSLKSDEWTTETEQLANTGAVSENSELTTELTQNDQAVDRFDLQVNKQEEKASLKDQLLEEVRNMEGQESIHSVRPETCNLLKTRVSKTKLDLDDSHDWLDVFEENDIEALFATVRLDMLNRQRLKKEYREKKTVGSDHDPPSSQGKNELTQGEKKDEKTQLQAEIDRRKMRSVVKELVRKTADQEVNHTVLRVCRFIVECIRQSSTTRSIAKETFYMLDTWLSDAHRKEQSSVDTFVDKAAEAFEADDSFAVDDPKRWLILN